MRIVDLRTLFETHNQTYDFGKTVVKYHSLGLSFLDMSFQRNYKNVQFILILNIEQKIGGRGGRRSFVEWLGQCCIIILSL